MKSFADANGDEIFGAKTLNGERNAACYVTDCSVRLEYPHFYFLFFFVFAIGNWRKFQAKRVSGYSRKRRKVGEGLGFRVCYFVFSVMAGCTDLG